MEAEVRSSFSEDEQVSVGASSYEVMSEVHIGCPPRNPHPYYLSTFTYPSPPPTPGLDHVAEGSSNNISYDEDGDLLLTRHTKSSNNCKVTIQHSIMSTIPSVGLQVWRAELVLADFVLHNLFTSKAFDKIVALELGAGTGLLGILLASFAQTVFLTDHGDGILDNCALNAQLNSHIHNNHQTAVYVRELDWTDPWPPSFAPNRSKKYSWSPSEVEKADNASVLLAADVIYSDELTDAFFRTLKTIMSRGCKKVLYLALEKRYNFSIDDLDIVANGYSHFRSYLMDDAEECKKVGNGFVGKEIEVADIPQYVREYHRENDVEIWEIEYLVVSQ